MSKFAEDFISGVRMGEVACREAGCDYVSNSFNNLGHALERGYLTPAELVLSTDKHDAQFAALFDSKTFAEYQSARSAAWAKVRMFAGWTS